MFGNNYGGMFRNLMQAGGQQPGLMQARNNWGARFGNYMQTMPQFNQQDPQGYGNQMRTWAQGLRGQFGGGAAGGGGASAVAPGGVQAAVQPPYPWQG